MFVCKSRQRIGVENHSRFLTPSFRDQSVRKPLLLIDLRGLFAQVFEFANMSHPRFLAWLGCGTELVLHRLSHKLTERYASLGGDRLGPAEHQVRDFEGRFHIPIFMGYGLPVWRWILGGSSGLLFKAQQAAA
jgi:hypothetical protein